MSYNPENYQRIRQSYDHKYEIARSAADNRRAEIEATVPGIKEINRALSATGLEVLRVSLSTPNEAERTRALEDLRARNRELIARREDLMQTAGYPADYTEVRYDCPLCNDSGFLDDGKMCSCLRQSLYLADYQTSGLAAFDDTLSFERFSLQYYRNNADCLATMSRVFTLCREYAESFTLGEAQGKPSESLLFVGKTGLGKTHLSVAIGKAVLQKGYDVQYVSAPDLFASFEAERFGSGSSSDLVRSRRYFDCELLIIDDLGCELTNQFTISCLYNIINSRLIDRHRPTLISTNLYPAELRERYWDRIASRLTGEYRVLGFSGTDVREQKLRTAH